MREFTGKVAVITGAASGIGRAMAERCVREGMKVVLAVTIAPAVLAAQNPLAHWTDAVEARFGAAQPVLDYAVRVDPADTTGYSVTMHVRFVPDTFDVAMAAHPEYDDRYWRYVEGLSVAAASGHARIAQVEGPHWRVTGSGGDVVIRYRLALPPRAARGRASYRPFVSPTGALVGDLHGFMYVVGATLAPAHVAVDVPDGWRVATGLEPTVDPRIFFAPSAYVLADSPILGGRLREWTFAVGGVPHRVVYWPAPDAVPFDTATFVGGLREIVRGAIALFGRAPYRDYTFLLQDGAYGSLEHANSVTIGVPSADLATNPAAYFVEIAHEYFHAWNIIRVRPAEYGDVSFSTPPRPAELWWSEGATMYYADLLTRRAGLWTADSTRVAHLARRLGQYYTTSGNRLLSPERVSRATYGTQGAQLGDNTASTHLQGELITTALDLSIRSATGDRRSIDDVMRAMMDRHSGPAGFTSDDVAREVERVCACDMRGFFARHVHGRAPLDMNRYLALIGLTSTVTWTQALNRDGSPQPDRRFWAWQPDGETGLRLYVLDTASVWERAGLHTGDRLISLNDQPVSDLAAFRSIVGPLGIGDSLRVAVQRAAGVYRTTVVVTGYRRAVVTIAERPDATPAERARRAAWLRGGP